MDKPIPRKMVAAAYVLAAAVGVLMMTSVTSLLFAAKRDPGFPRLAENLAASAQLEVRRQIKGGIGGMLALPARREVIVLADNFLWRFSADGRLLDTHHKPGHMHMNGLSFGPDDYWDWVHTGVRERRPYARVVDGNDLDPAGLEAALAQAEVVSFSQDDGQAWAYLWKQGQAWKMDISRHLEQVDTYCTSRSSTEERLDWTDTCLRGRRPIGAQLAVEIRPGDFPGAYAGTPVEVDVVDFDRRRYHMEGGPIRHVGEVVLGTALKTAMPGLPGSLPSRSWFGDAHTRLRIGDQVLQFKVFVGKEWSDDDYAFLYMLDWWDPSRVIPGASPWLRVRMRQYIEQPGEEALWNIYKEDFGLYAIRPRSSPHDLPPPLQPVAAWTPVFEGPAPRGREPVTAQVHLAGGASVHRWLRERPPAERIVELPPPVGLDADQAPLQELPASMRVEWGAPWNAELRTVLDVQLDPAQARAAFARLDPRKTPARLVLKVPDLFGEVDGMQLALVQDKQEIVLDGSRIDYLTRPAFRYWRTAGQEPPQPGRMEQLSASAAAARAGDRRALARFQVQAQTLVGIEERVERSAYNITAEYAGLVNHYNTSGQADATVDLVRHYLDAIHPHTAWRLKEGERYNLSVIASQTLAVIVHRPQDQDLVQKVFAQLLDPVPDPDTHPNATLLYNLACYYALNGEREQMLRHVRGALRGGKPAAQFAADADFTAFRADPAFKALLAAPPTRQ